MRRPRAVGALVSWLGLLAALSVGLVAILLAITVGVGGTPTDYAIVAAAFVLAFLGRNAFRWGRRFSQESSEERMAGDARPIVLLLRAFEFDGDVAEKNWFQQRSLLALLLGRETFEGELARILEDIGPTVALGRKGEVLPTLGFAREYVPDDRWREVLADYFARAGWLVFVLYGITPNLTYELTEALTRKYPAKVLLVPPPLRHRTAAWRTACASLLESHLALSTWADDAAALILDREAGLTVIRMQGAHSSAAQIASIHETLVSRYLLH